MDHLSRDLRDHHSALPIRRSLVGVIVLGAVLCLGVWTLVLRSMWHTPAPTPPAEPAVPQISVTGYADQLLTSDGVHFSISVCSDSGTAALVRPSKALVMLAKQRLGPNAIQQVEHNDDDACRTFAVSSTKVAAALAWRHEMLAQEGGIRIESEGEVECTGLVAATRRSLEARAIEDARSKAEALAGAAHIAITGLVSADASSEEGSWDDDCGRTLTATATLTVK